MPFYEYECSKCGYHDEVLQKINDKPLKKCPKCGKTSLRKLMSAPVFRLKGSGWYETDFKSDKENKRNLAGADKDETPGGKQDDASKDSKTDASKAEAAKTETGKADAGKAVAGKSEAVAKPSREGADKSTSRSAKSRAPRPKPKTRGARKTRR